MTCLLPSAAVIREQPPERPIDFDFDFDIDIDTIPHSAFLHLDAYTFRVALQSMKKIGARSHYRKNGKYRSKGSTDLLE